MSGSMTYRGYTADDGSVYTLKVDESNANAIATNGAGLASGVLLPVRIANSGFPPCGLKPRYVNTYNRANRNQRRTFKYSTAVQQIILSEGATITAEDYPAGGGTGPGVVQTWVVTKPVGETKRKAPPFNAPDTGLDDGTVSQ
jgi:hypothetical protein